MKLFTIIAPTCLSLLCISAHANNPKNIMKDEVLTRVSVPYNWTGYYAGINVGAVNHTMNISDTQAATFLGTIQQSSNPSPTGGLQIGYRRQIDMSGVFGGEFSANFANADFSKQYGSPFALYQLNSNNQLKTVCLLQLIGGIAADRTLLFLAAGLSWSNITGSTTNIAGAPFFNTFSVDSKQFGTALGGGIEYAYNDTISARVKVDVITPTTYTTTDDTGNSYLIANNIVQGTFGINYKFA